MNIVSLLLYPFSLIYNAVTAVRNLLFAIGIKKETGFGVSVISVGNLSVGGTGKTPHVEYLVKLLQPYKTLAVLSRGYKRTTKGYILLSSETTAAESGDEPLQIKRKFPQLSVAVCEKRIVGITSLLHDVQPDCIILDDAFQHRYVKPGLQILLTDFAKPYWNDYVLPSGRLRENRTGAKRADIIIVTKCPPDLSKRAYEEIIKKAALQKHQKLYCTGFEYQGLTDLHQGTNHSVDMLLNKKICVLTGIANPQSFHSFVKDKATIVKQLTFADHHRFSQHDYETIAAAYRQSAADMIVTTEKDAVRLDTSYFQNIPIYYIPIQVSVLFNEESSLNTIVRTYAEA